MNKNLFCVSSKNNCFENNGKTSHWVAHSQLRSLDTDDFFKMKLFVDDIQASVTRNTTKQSVSGGGLTQIYYKNKKKL